LTNSILCHNFCVIFEKKLFLTIVITEFKINYTGVVEKLPKSPLVKVEFKLWWHLFKDSDYNGAGLLFGKVYNKLSEKYPNIQDHAPNSTEFEFFHDNPKIINESHDSLPYLSLDRRSFKFVSEHSVYEWEEFKKEILSNSEIIIGILDELINPDHYHLELKYSNLFKSISVDLSTFISNKLNTEIKGPSMNEGKIKDFRMQKKFDKAYGTVTIEMGSTNKDFGLMFHSESNKIKPNIKDFSQWVSTAHDNIENLFIELTKGDLYESFS